MSGSKTSFQSGIRSTSEFMEPINLDDGDPQVARQLTETLRTFGLALVRSRHYDVELRSTFLNRFLDYLTSNLDIRAGKLVIDMRQEDLRPDVGFQYGPTPIGQETALCTQKENHARCKAFVDRLEPRFAPFTIPGTDYPDRKGRFMAHLVTWRGTGKSETGSPTHGGNLVGTLAADPATTVVEDPMNVIPGYLTAEERKSWRDTLDAFGMMMLEPVTEVSKKLAVGLGLPEDYFVSLMNNGHHKVAPTFASLYEQREPGIVQAALHEDIDVFAIHAQGTHSGLYVYTETGERLQVRVPVGCYLVQAGRQLYLKMRSMERTGEIPVPPIQPGWHEVIATPDAIEKTQPDVDAINTILADPKMTKRQKLDAIRPIYQRCIRISCTFFYHFGDETKLVYGLADGEREEQTFPEGTKIQRYIGLELGFIKLKS